MDKQGRVRELRVATVAPASAGMFQRVEDVSTMTFSDFGTPVLVLAPPPGQVRLGGPPPVSRRIPRLDG